METGTELGTWISWLITQELDRDFVGLEIIAIGLCTSEDKDYLNRMLGECF